MATLQYKLKKTNSKIPLISLLLVIFSVLFLAIGFSTYQAALDIRDITANVRAQKDIRVSEVLPSNPVSGAISNWADYDVQNIKSNITLPNSDSSITYKVKITNIGNIEAGIVSISGLPSNLKYTISNYNVGDVLCDDANPSMCKLGSVTTLDITISYAPNSYDSNNTTFNMELDFDFFYLNSVARIGNKFYETLKDAILDVSAGDPETTIVLLSNTSEILSVAANKQIIIDLNNKEVSNVGNAPIMENNGTLVIKNGTIRSDASANGALNNQSTGTITLDNVNVYVTGGRQALYNNKGTATIKGNSILSTTTTERTCVQNVTPGVLTILGGNITSNGSSGVQNTGTLVIGYEDGTANNDTINIQGVKYGVTSNTSFSLYDGYVRGKESAFNNDNRIANKETNHLLYHEVETIANEDYDLAYMAIPVEIIFDANGGAVSEGTMNAPKGRKIGRLPIPNRSGHIFLGWFTLADGGEEVNENFVVNNPQTFYAHWEQLVDVALVGTTLYNSVQEAINAAPNNTPTTIQLLKNTSEIITVPSTKNIIFDFNDKTLTNSGNNQVITNTGTLSIISGNITSNADYATIDQNSGVLNISGGNIISTGTRQAIYVKSGVVNISGNAYLSSTTSGSPTTSSIERGTIHILATGTVNITGGTIVATKQNAVSNEGTLTIGTKDGSIDSTTPVLIGTKYGVKSLGTFNYYDGIMKGIIDAYAGSITDTEANSNIVSGTEIIDATEYHTAHLQ